MTARATIASVLLAVFMTTPADAAPKVTKAKATPTAVAVPEAAATAYRGARLIVGEGTHLEAAVKLQPLPKSVAGKVRGLLKKIKALPELPTISSADAQQWLTEIESMVGTPAEWSSVNEYGGNSYRDTRALALLETDRVYLKIVIRTSTTQPGEDIGTSSWSDWSHYVPLAEADVSLDTSDGMRLVVQCRPTATGAKNNCIIMSSGQTTDSTNQRLSPFSVPQAIAPSLDEAVERRLRLLSVYAAQR